jgi:hypothetical protein
MSELGHQLESEIAEKEIYQESYHRLQGTDAIYNTTDRRKLSVARVLNGAELLRLRDARLAKDAKKPCKGVKRTATRGKRATRCIKKRNNSKAHSRGVPHLGDKSDGTRPLPEVREVVIGDSSMVIFIDPESERGESEEEEVSDKEWELIPANNQRTTGNHGYKRSREKSVSNKLLPDRPLHMSLRSRKPTSSSS